MSKPAILDRVYRRIKKNFKAILLGIAILLFFITPLRDLLNQDILTNYLQRAGIWAVPIFVSTYIVLAILGLPITIHTLAGGFVFGLGWGTIWSTLAATLGAVGAFYLTRSIFQDWASTTFGKHKLLKKIEQAIDLHPFNLILSLRIAPIAPFNLVNFLLALTPVTIQIYTLATFVGIIPGTIAYTWLGASGKTALQDGDLLQFLLAASFLVFLSSIPLWFKPLRRS